MNQDVCTAITYQIKSEAILRELRRRLRNDHSFNYASLFDILDSNGKGYISAFDLVNLLQKQNFRDIEEKQIIFLLQPLIKNKLSHTDLYSKEGKSLFFLNFQT